MLKQPLNIARLLVEIVAIIAAAEAVVMFLLPVLAPGVGEGVGAVLDAGLLSCLAGPIILWRLLAAVRRTDRSVEITRAASTWRLRLGVLAVGAAGLVASATIAAKEREATTAEARAKFDRLAERAATEVARRVNRPVYGLRGARGVYAASKSVERAEFRAYVESRDLAREFPGVLGFGVIERVPLAEVPSFLERERQDEAPDLAIHPDPQSRTGTAAGGDLLVIKSIYPQERNRPAWGFDISSEPHRHEAALRAIRTGEPAITSKIRLVQDPLGRSGFLYMVPVYRNGTSPQTPEEREASLACLVYTPIILEDAMAAMDPDLASLIDIEIFDGPGEDVASLLYDRDGDRSRNPGSHPAAMFNDTTQQHVGGRVWTLVSRSTPLFESRIDRATPIMLGVVGLVMTMLLAATLWAVGNGRERALAAARAMTAELRATNAKAERLAEIARRTSNAVVVADATGRIEWVNEGFTRLTGYSLEEARGHIPGELLQGRESDPAEAARMGEAIRRGEPVHAELINYGKNGRPYLVEIEIAPLRNADGTLTGFMALETDVTQRREWERRLAEGEARIRAIIEGAELLAWEFCVEDDRFTFLSFSEERYGYSKQQWLKPGFWDSMLHPQDRGPVTEECLGEIRAGRPHRLNYRVLTATGGELHISDYVSAPEHIEGKTIVRGVAMDVTQQRRMLDRLAESEAMFRTLCDSTPNFVWTSDASGNRGYFNRYWLEFRGRTLEQERGTGWMSGVHPDDLSRYTELLATSYASALPFEIEYRLQRANGQYRTILARGVPRLDAGGALAGYVGACSDITDLRVAQVRAEMASRSKSEFLANMSHEIRTPLTAILGHAELLREGADTLSARSRSEMLDTIRSAGSHLLTVINDILDISKIEADRMTVECVPTHLTGILREVEDLMKSRLVQGCVQLSVELATPLPDRILSDPTRLRQILMNLAGNALKFTEAGRVRIVARIEDVRSYKRLMIDVEDTGLGMTQEQSSRLFQPFSQADATVTRRHGGTGLGLVICRRLAMLMGGDVSLVRSEPGQGSTFRLDLPLAPAPGANLVTTLASGESKPSGAATPSLSLRGRVLFAEDGVDNQRLIAHHLKKAGADVQIAPNGRVALDMLREADSRGERYDLLLTDMQMPEMDGYTLARTLRADGSRLPVIALTAHAMADDQAKCLAAGCDACATKPIERAKLLALCAEWIGRTGGVGNAHRAA